MGKIIKILKNPKIVVKKMWCYGVRHNWYKWMPDKLYLKLRFKELMGTKLDIENPRTLNEKIQWLKLYDRNPVYCTLVDKYHVREWVKSTIGDEYLIPLIGRWDNVDDIDFSILPDQFVLKCTHGSHCNVICKNKNSLDADKVKKDLKKWMRINYYYYSREWPYKSIHPQIVAEKYIISSNANELIDYKFYCYNGTPQFVMLCYGRDAGNLRFFYFDEEWNFYRLNKGDDMLPRDFSIPKPDCIPDMFNIARTLSKGIPFVRVDLYESENRIYFGEMTFYPTGGFDLDILPSTDAMFGEMLNLKK